MQLITTAKWAKEVGLQVNTSKTQVLTNQNTDNKSIQLNGQIIQWVNDFKCLGSMVLSRSINIKTRKGQEGKRSGK